MYLLFSNFVLDFFLNVNIFEKIISQKKYNTDYDFHPKSLFLRNLNFCFVLFFFVFCNNCFETGEENFETLKIVFEMFIDLKTFV